MKTKVNKPLPAFPALYHVPATGTVVLMTDERTGTVVDVGEDSSYEIGAYYQDWVIADNPHGLQYLRGSITLIN